MVESDRLIPCPLMIYYVCAKAHGVSFCGICVEFTCKGLIEKIHWNPDVAAHLKILAE